MECPVCHKEIPAGAAFCAHCGASITAGSGFSPVTEFSSGPSPEQPFNPTPGYTAPTGAGYTPPPPGYPPPGYPPPGSGYPPPAGGYAPPPPGYPGSAPAAAAGLSANMAAALAYVTIIPAIVFLVVEPYNRIKLVRFHSFQSIGLFVAALVIHLAITILQVATHFIPATFLLFGALHGLVSLAFFVIWLIVLLKAGKGEFYKLPVIGDFAEKQARG